MHCTIISLIFLFLAVVICEGKTGASNDGCACVSSSFGCDNLKGRAPMVQTGWCNKRCCEESNNVPGEKRKCQCMNKKDCPDHMPVEEGDCLNLVECCPKKKKSEL